MNSAAQHVLRVLPDVMLAYGHSDEYSFIFHKSCTLFERRSAKLASTVVSTFTSAYMHLWPDFFASNPEEDTYFVKEISGEGNGLQHADGHRSGQLDLSYLPTFDARCITYPSDQNIRDYIAWRQADCHINNLYNTTFWALVLKGGMSNTEAEEFLKGTVSSDKNEILWSKFGVNYNNQKDVFKKGSLVLREYELVEATQDGRGGQTKQTKNESSNPKDSISKTQQEKAKKARQRARIIIQHIDAIKDDFWTARPWLLSGGVGKPIS